jgi:hypothetical protein
MFETIHRKGEVGKKEWREREEEYFRFIDFGIEPANNAAELTIRHTVLDRVVTQGNRGIHSPYRCFPVCHEDLPPIKIFIPQHPVNRRGL